MHDRGGRVTRKDVARVAGTSVAVVSYVVNNGPRPVSKALRERVIEAIKETGYRPNGVAKALALGTTGTIGLLVPNIKNPYLSELAHSVGNAARQRGLNILLGDSADDRQQEASLLENFVLNRVEGLLFYGVDGCPPELEKLRDTTRVLVFDSWDSPSFAHCMRLDEGAAAFKAVDHLAEHGRQRIAMITGPLDQRNSRIRMQGWAEALRARGLQEDSNLLQSAPYSRSGGYQAGEKLIESAVDFDGLFAANESQAVGFLAACFEAGVAVPKDVAVAALNGTSMGSFTIPSLTTFEQCVADNAESAVECLLQAKEPQLLAAQGGLIRRSSCGCESSYV